MAGKYDDAEKAFKAAIDLEPKYNTAWQGIALARAYRGDWKGALEANETQNANAVDTYDSVEVVKDGAWLAFAAGDTADAITRMDVIEKDEEAKKTPAYALAAIARAQMLQLAGKSADAAKWLDTGRTRGEALPGFTKKIVSRDHAIGVLRNAALAGAASPDADKLLAGLDGDAKEDPGAASYAAWGPRPRGVGEDRREGRDHRAREVPAAAPPRVASISRPPRSARPAIPPAPMRPRSRSASCRSARRARCTSSRRSRPLRRLRRLRPPLRRSNRAPFGAARRVGSPRAHHRDRHPLRRRIPGSRPRGWVRRAARWARDPRGQLELDEPRRSEPEARGARRCDGPGRRARRHARHRLDTRPRQQRRRVRRGLHRRGRASVPRDRERDLSPPDRAADHALRSRRRGHRHRARELRRHGFRQHEQQLRHRRRLRSSSAPASGSTSPTRSSASSSRCRSAITTGRRSRTATSRSTTRTSTSIF